MVFLPFKVINNHVVGEDAHVTFLMIKKNPKFYNGVKKLVQHKSKICSLVFNRLDWHIVCAQYKIAPNVVLNHNALIAVDALIHDVLATRTTAIPSPPPTPTPTPMCYIVCTCGKPDCRLKQNQLRQQHNPSSAKVHKPVFKK